MGSIDGKGTQGTRLDPIVFTIDQKTHRLKVAEEHNHEEAFCHDQRILACCRDAYCTGLGDNLLQ
jgi:hypothetical protein